MKHGVAETLVWVLTHMKSLGFSIYNDALPHVLHAACELASVSSEMRVRLAEAGILAAAEVEVENCHGSPKKGAADMLKSLSQAILSDPAACHRVQEPPAFSELSFTNDLND